MTGGRHPLPTPGTRRHQWLRSGPAQEATALECPSRLAPRTIRRGQSGRGTVGRKRSRPEASSAQWLHPWLRVHLQGVTATGRRHPGPLSAGLARRRWTA
jgi:hypothetical protein